MKEIKFTTNYESTLSFNERDFKKKYEERVGDNQSYCQVIDGEQKHLAVCPKCNNPVVILGIYKKIKEAPHARHAKNISMSGVATYNEYKYLHCPYHQKHANYVKEYVPETEEDNRKELYKIAKNNYDKAIYLLKKTTGIYITNQMADSLAENYVKERAYNYIDATLYNIPWYLLYCHMGFPLYHMVIKKGTTIYKHLLKMGIALIESRIPHHVYVAENNGYLLRATEYRYSVDKDENLNEWLDFSLLLPDESEKKSLLYKSIDRFSISVDSYHFGNLINYPKWKTNTDILEIAKKHMNP